MFKVTREISFCYGHRLLNYSGKCKNLHGHNGVAVVTIEAQELDELGMVTDFAAIKTVVSAGVTCSVCGEGDSSPEACWEGSRSGRWYGVGCGGVGM